MPSKDGFVFKPPHFPRFDSIVPSAIFNGDSRRLYYIRWVIRAIVAILFTVTCCLFGSTVAARVVFGRNVHECTGTIGEVHHSNDHSVSVVIPQIAMAIFILTFAVVFMSYNVLVQFLIVLTILEGVTFLVWKYQFPVGSVELEKHLFVRIVTRRMIKCHVISNRTAVEPCWERFMTDYCQEWAATEIRLCPMTTTTVQPSSTVFPEIRNASVGDNTSPVMTNIYRCYKRFMKHPWTNVTREEEYMEVLSPHVKALMSVHVITVTFLYLAARTYVREFRRLRDDWIMELQMYYIRLNNTVKEFKGTVMILSSHTPCISRIFRKV